MAKLCNRIELVSICVSFAKVFFCIVHNISILLAIALYIAISIAIDIDTDLLHYRFSMFDNVFFGNTMEQYLWALIVFALSFVVFFVLHKYLFVWADTTIKKYKHQHSGTYAIAHALLSVPLAVLGIFSFYIGLQFLILPPQIQSILSALFVVFVVLWSGSVLSVFFGVLVTKISNNRDEKSVEMTKNIVKLTIKVIVWITAGLLILINLGVQITPLLASLGIGGIAIAFALQNILQDIFASFSIFLEKPFSLGDFVVVGDTRGTVKHISFKSTYIQALEGQMIVVPNKDIMQSRIQNYGGMKRRRHKQTIGVLYETPVDVLQKIPSLIQEEIDRIDGISYHRAHIRELSAYSIDIEFAYYIESKEMSFFLDKNQELLMSLLTRFATEHITIAYPTQLVYTQKSS